MKRSSIPAGRHSAAAKRVTMRLVVVETPFAGRLEVNKSYLAACLRDCYTRGESPFASHAIGPLALNDLVPAEREMGIQAGFAWRSRADATVVYKDFGISRGMAAEIAEAPPLPTERVHVPRRRRREPSAADVTRLVHFLDGAYGPTAVMSPPSSRAGWRAVPDYLWTCLEDFRCNPLPRGGRVVAGFGAARDAQR
jgi:hypothetical protein